MVVKDVLMNSYNAGKDFATMWTFIPFDSGDLVLFLHVRSQISRLRKPKIIKIIELSCENSEKLKNSWKYGGIDGIRNFHIAISR